MKAIKSGENGKIKPAAKVQEVIGSALSRIGPYKKLDNTKQVVALIDDVSFSSTTAARLIFDFLLSGSLHQLRQMLHDVC